MTSKILLTGSTGFIGSHIAETLVEEGYDLICLVRKTSDLSYLKDLKITIKYGSLNNVISINDVIKDIDIVIHNAGLTKALKTNDYFKTNVESTKNLLESIKQVNPNLKQFIYIGSHAAAGPNSSEDPIDESYLPNPISPYGESKLQGEKTALEYTKYFPVTVLRPTAVFGPREKDIYFYFQTINKGLMPFLGNFDPKISLIYVKDLVNAICLSILNQKAYNQVFFVSDNKAYKWSDVANNIQQVLGKKCLKFRIPFWILHFVAFFSEMSSVILKKPPLLNKYKMKELSQRYWICSSDKIMKELGYKPKWDLNSALQETAQWYKKNGWLQ